MVKVIQLKIKIANAAAERFVENNRFTIQSLAEKINIKSEKIDELFPSRTSILKFYYESRLILYHEDIKQLTGYSDYSLSEKLTHLFLQLLDQFEQNKEFVKLTYNKIVLHPDQGSAFAESLIKEVKTIFEKDNRIATSAALFRNELSYKLLLLQFHAIIHFWMNDESPMSENSLALVDKLCAVIEEVFYSKILDKGFDFGKFLYYHSPLARIIHKHSNS